MAAAPIPAATAPTLTAVDGPSSSAGEGSSLAFPGVDAGAGAGEDLLVFAPEPLLSRMMPTTTVAATVKRPLMPRPPSAGFFAAGAAGSGASVAGGGGACAVVAVASAMLTLV
eukprot:CAMPEP_0117677070 /NCGR_PEP_ID=MMETSP0804-20121206/16546_1 /TAXON_ID=1074897 /ORGANISM="Tetraselmis astigmatica, Strain CCMP880" /LENGTH=112 /DNA_ID=CAMNT_0005486323 /DNA_START=222 /DNA_END=560 /DNA_ORIENTATION=-